MSLQIWLPLNGNLDNMGLNDSSFNFINEETGINNNQLGKIGNCFQKDKKTSNYIKSDKPLNLNEDITIACWTYISNMANGDNGLVSNHDSTTGSGLGIVFKYLSATDCRISYNTKAEECGATNIYNAWHHLALTYNQKSQILTLYVDGKIDCVLNNYVNTPAYNYVNIFNWNTSLSSGLSEDSVYKINDVRIYDECLSKKEILEISKGLILHYPLRDNSITTVTNLLPEPVLAARDFDPGWDASLHPGAVDVNNWSDGYNAGVPTPEVGYHAYWKEIDGDLVQVFTNRNVIDGYTSKKRWLGFSNSSGRNEIGASIEPAKPYTFSLYAKADNEEGSQISIGLSYWIKNSSTPLFHDGLAIFTLTSDWKHYEATFVANKDFDASKSAIVYVYGDTGAEKGISYVKNVQLEVGAVSNDYIVGTREADNIIIDCSGYSYDATVEGTVTMEKNSPRNVRGAHFYKGSWAQTEPLKIPEVHTISLWAKREEAGCAISWNESANIKPVTFNDKGQLCYSNSETSSYFSYIFNPETWYHIALAYDGSKVKLYVDGVYKESKDMTLGTLEGSLTFGNMDIALSDLRIYSTVLSDKEIEKIYNSPIWIGESQNVGAIQFCESGINNVKFEKNGVVSARSVGEGVNSSGMKIKALQNDGSIWARIHYLDLSADSTCFKDNSEVFYCIDKNNRFSIMKDVEKFKKGATLPQGYTKLQYIESTGTQYIDTEAFWTHENIGIHLDASIVEDASGQSLFGNEEYIDDTSNRFFAGTLHKLQDSYTIFIGSGSRGSVNLPIKQRFTIDVQTTDKKVKVFVDKEKKIESTYSQSAITKANAYVENTVSPKTVGHIYLFANHNSQKGTSSSPTQIIKGMQVYSFKMYDNDTLIRNFIPCKNIDGEVGLYDTIGDKFYKNAGTGNFKAGPISADLIGFEESGGYEFMLTYPSLSSEKYNRWKQTISPNSKRALSLDGTGYEEVHTDFSQWKGPITIYDDEAPSSTLYTCAIGNSAWYAPIGQFSIYNGGIPAANGTIQKSTELWVRIDQMKTEDLVKIYDKYISTNQMIEF